MAPVRERNEEELVLNPFQLDTGCWVCSKENMQRLAAADRLEAAGDSLSYIYCNTDFPYSKVNNLWNDKYREPMSYIAEPGRTYAFSLYRDFSSRWPFSKD